MIALRPLSPALLSTMAEDLPGVRLQEISGRLQAARAIVESPMIARWRPSSHSNIHFEENTFLPKAGNDSAWVPTVDKLQFVREGLEFLQGTLSCPPVRQRFEQHPQALEHAGALAMMERLLTLAEQPASAQAHAFRTVSPFRQAVE